MRRIGGTQNELSAIKNKVGVGIARHPAGHTTAPLLQWWEVSHRHLRCDPRGLAGVFVGFA